MSKLTLVGGPHSGKLMEDVGPILKMPKQVPLSPYLHGDGERQIMTASPEDRYIAKQIHSDGSRYWLYVYEYDIDRNHIELLLSELRKATGAAA
jgi:hypothetical protein